MDGYSRFQVYLHAASNKRASTVLGAFTAAVEEFGIPSRIRADKGTENVQVAMWMLTHPSRGVGRGSFITGPSTRNQRVERSWRECFERCIFVFHSLFCLYEEEGNLNIESLDLLALHYTYLPVIQNHLNVFLATWNNHAMRTENQMTPQQLFLSRKADTSDELPVSF